MTDLYVLCFILCFKTDSTEANCLLASIELFILYTVVTVNCQNVHAVYLAAS